MNVLSACCHSAHSCSLDICLATEYASLLAYSTALWLAWAPAGHVATEPWAIDLYGLLFILVPAFPGPYCVLEAPVRLLRTLWKWTDLEWSSCEPQLSLWTFGAHCLSGLGLTMTFTVVTFQATIAHISFFKFENNFPSSELRLPKGTL